MSTIKIPIVEIIIGERYRKNLGNIQSLADSIRDVGLLHPIVITPDKKLIAGARRIAAFELLKRDVIPARTVDTDMLLAQSDENKQRKDFTPSEAVAIGREIEAVERPKAKERQREAARRSGIGSAKLVEPMPIARRVIGPESDYK